jgi:cell division control protein 24
MEHFTLRCRNEEQMTKWEAAINKLIQDVKDRRASERLSSSRVRSMAGEPSPMSRTPSTAYDRGLTMSTVGPSTRSPYTSNGASAGRARPTTPFGEDFANGNFPQNVGSGPAGYPGSEGFINEDTDDYEDYPPALHAAPSGRGTPLGTRRNGSRTPVGYSEEARQSSYTNGGPPPLPHNGLPSGPASRGPMSRQSNPISRMSSTASVSGADGIAGAGRRPGGLRSQFSSTRLNSQYEQNNGNGDVPSLPPAQRNGAPIGPTRSRSASQPQAYIPRQAQPPPPLPNIGKWEQQPSTDGSKRGSGSSQSTENSSDYSPDASSPATPYGSSDSSLGGYEMPYKVKVHFHEDIFVVSVPPRVEYADLVDKIGKKIRLCGPRRDDGPLRVKYQDEDGDMVSLGSTEDVQMAFESVRPGGLVTLFVT